MSLWRTRWAAFGAAVAVALGGGGLGLVQATTSSGEKPIYKPINPCRLADTRPAPDNVGGRSTPIGAEESFTLTGWGAVGNCSLPSGTAGLALNVTAVAPSQATYLTLYPTGASLPTTSNLNPTPGQPPTPNAVNVALNGSGRFDVFNKYGTVHVIADVVGYYDDHNHDDRYYTEDEMNAAFDAKANTADVYTKAELDDALATKVDLVPDPGFVRLTGIDFMPTQYYVNDVVSMRWGSALDSWSVRLSPLEDTCFVARATLPTGAVFTGMSTVHAAAFGGQVGVATLYRRDPIDAYTAQSETIAELTMTLPGGELDPGGSGTTQTTSFNEPVVIAENDYYAVVCPYADAGFDSLTITYLLPT